MSLDFKNRKVKLLGYFALFLFFLTSCFTAFPLISRADDASVNTALNGLNATAQEAQISTSRTVTQIAGSVFNLVLGFLGVIFLVLVISGGFTWMTAGGNEDKIKHGRNLITWAAIGLAVILFAFLVVNYVIFNIIHLARNGG